MARVVHNRRKTNRTKQRRPVSKKRSFWSRIKLAPFLIVGVAVGIIYVFRDSLIDNATDIFAVVAGFGLTIVLFHTLYIAIVIVVLLVITVLAFLYLWRRN